MDGEDFMKMETEGLTRELKNLEAKYNKLASTKDEYNKEKVDIEEMRQLKGEMDGMKEEIRLLKLDNS